MKTSHLIWLSVLVLAPRFEAHSQPAGAVFTYQGMLRDASLPANGSYDLRFVLHSSATGENPVGGPVTNQNVTVANGLFASEVDFGAAALAGGERWLELGIRPTGSANPFSLLAPRHRLTFTPYSVLSLDGLRLGGVPPASYARVDSPASQSFSGPITFSLAPVFAATSGPPFQVSSAAVISNLNAEFLDGEKASALAHLNRGNTFTSSNLFLDPWPLTFSNANGTVFKVLMAPLVVELDNRISLNIHGNLSSGPPKVVVTAEDLNGDSIGVAVRAGTGSGGTNKGHVFLEPTPGAAVTFGAEQEPVKLTIDFPPQPLGSERPYRIAVGPGLSGVSGTPLLLQGGDSTGTNEGGSIYLRTGTNSSGAQAPLKVEASNWTWLVPADRQLTSPLELLAVSAYSPGQLLGRFGLSNGQWRVGVSNEPPRIIATFNTDGKLDADSLGGHAAMDYARLGLPNYWSQPQDFGQGFRLENSLELRSNAPVVASGGSFILKFPTEPSTDHPVRFDLPDGRKVQFLVTAPDEALQLTPQAPGFIWRAMDARGTNQSGGDITVQPGASTGTGLPGKFTVQLHPPVPALRLAFVDTQVQQATADTVVTRVNDSLGQQPMPIGPGWSYAWQAGDGQGTNQNGGDIIVVPGKATGTGANGVFMSTSPRFVLDSDNTNEAATVEIVANQGTEPAGTLRYNSSGNHWEISEHGGPFLALATRSAAGGLDADSLGGHAATNYPRVNISNYWSQAQDFDSTCWVRTVAFHTGGSFVLPRVGWEVAVDFQSGDTNRPVVVNQYTNHADAPPYHGTSHRIEAGDALGGNMDGGSITLKAGSASGSGTNGAVYLEGQSVLAYLGPSRKTFETTFLESSSTVALRLPFDAATSEDGTSLSVEAQPGTGVDADGGNIVLRPGPKTGSGVPGMLMVNGDPAQTGVNFKFSPGPHTLANASVFRIADDSLPNPQDRVFFNYDYFNGLSWRGTAQGSISGNAATATTASNANNALQLLNVPGQNFARRDQTNLFLDTCILSAPANKVAIEFVKPAGSTEPYATWRLDNGTVIGTISSNGAVQAPAFSGDGAGLTNVPPPAKVGTAASGATPSVSGATILKLEGYNSPTVVTDLADGKDGQIVVVIGGNNPVPIVVADDNSGIPGNFRLRGNSDVQMLPNTTLTLARCDGVWFETARSSN
jgi:hypothetical protein